MFSTTRKQVDFGWSGSKHNGYIVLHGHNYTPFHVAVFHRAPDGTLQLLIDSGAESEARTDEGLTPLLIAAERGKCQGGPDFA